MQIVIDIPEEAYKLIMEFGFLEHTHGRICYKAIKNGVPLSKGHGRLIDADERRKEIDEEDRWVVDLAETIIEADKE